MLLLLLLCRLDSVLLSRTTLNSRITRIVCFCSFRTVRELEEFVSLQVGRTVVDFLLKPSF